MEKAGSLGGGYRQRAKKARLLDASTKHESKVAQFLVPTWIPLLPISNLGQTSFIYKHIIVTFVHFIITMCVHLWGKGG